MFWLLLVPVSNNNLSGIEDRKIGNSAQLAGQRMHFRYMASSWTRHFASMSDKIVVGLERRTPGLQEKHMDFGFE
jgi:hypothetical protein